VIGKMPSKRLTPLIGLSFPCGVAGTQEPKPEEAEEGC